MRIPCHDVLRCPECGAPMRLKRGWYGLFWGCSRFPDCRGSHGAHQDSGLPLGTPADQRTRQLRIAAHAAFDRLWREPGGRMTRPEAYRLLQELMDLPEDRAHIGLFSAEECQRLIEILREREAA